MNSPFPAHSRVTWQSSFGRRRSVLSPARATAPIARRSRVTLLGAALACGLTCVSVQPAAAQADGSTFPRVRSTNGLIATVLHRAGEQSATFRRLVEAIGASDGTVYVEEGKCRYGFRACLVTVTMAGANRYLWVKVDTRMADWDLMASIGHELQHAIEVLSDRTVTSGFAMYYFYLGKGPHSIGLAFETDAAIEAGDAVRTEVRKYRPHNQVR
jgi:hypothetical protein